MLKNCHFLIFIFYRLLLCIILLGIELFPSFFFLNLQKSGCELQKFFLSFNLLVSFFLSLISIHPKVQDARTTSGLLQASIISAYCIFLALSAVIVAPERNCRPGKCFLRNLMKILMTYKVELYKS